MNKPKVSTIKRISTLEKAVVVLHTMIVKLEEKKCKCDCDESK